MVIRPAFDLGRVLSLLALLALAVPAFTAAALPREVVGDKHPHPEDRTVLHRGVAIPCDQPRASLTLSAGQAHAFADTTTGDSEVASYACRAWDESGPEHIYLLELTEELVLDAWLGGNLVDHDLILLSDCDSDSCLTQQNTEFSAWLPAGQYVLVVDGFQGAAGAYTLNLTTREPGLPTVVCTGDQTSDLGDFVGGESEPLGGTLFDQPNHVSVWDCAVTATHGGEQWYQVTLAANDQTYDDGTDIGTVRLDIAVTPVSSTLDVALWLFDGCGVDAVCLGFADDHVIGAPEDLRLLNDLPEPFTVYLAVDCVSAPVDSASGAFEITVDGTVPVEARSLSDLRGLFR
jgi:hypothetical protein